MLFRTAALAVLALSVSTDAFSTTPVTRTSSALFMSEATAESETEFDKSLIAGIRNEVRSDTSWQSKLILAQKL